MSNIQIKPHLIELENRITPIIEQVMAVYVNSGQIVSGKQITQSQFRILGGTKVTDEGSIAYVVRIKLDPDGGRMSASVTRDRLQISLSSRLLEEKVTVVQGDRFDKADKDDTTYSLRLIFTPAEVFAREAMHDFTNSFRGLMLIGAKPEEMLNENYTMAAAVWKENSWPYWYFHKPLNSHALRPHFHSATYLRDLELVRVAFNEQLAPFGLEVLRLDRDSLLVSLAGMCPDLTLEDKRWAQAFYDCEEFGLQALGPYLPEDARDFLFPYAEHVVSNSTWGGFFKAIRLRGLEYPLEDHLIDDIIAHDRPLGVTGQFEVQFQLLHALVYNEQFRRRYHQEQRSIRMTVLRECLERKNAQV